MCAIGQLFAYVVGAIDTVSIFGTFIGDTQFKQMTVIAAFSLVLAVAITSYSVKERVLITARLVSIAMKPMVQANMVKGRWWCWCNPGPFSAVQNYFRAAASHSGYLLGPILGLDWYAQCVGLSGTKR